MTALKTFINQNMFLTLFAVLITILSATSTYAGFEWVPQKKKAVIDEPEMIQVRPVQQPETTAIVPAPLAPLPEDDVVLPLPANNYAAAPAPAPVVQAPPVAMAAPAPVYMPPPAPAAPAPLPLTSAAVPVSASTPPPVASPTQAPMSIKAPSRVVVTPNEAPNSGVIMHHDPVASLPPLPEPVAAPAPPPAPAEHTLSRKELVMPPVDRTNMRIIVPDDAPQSAVDKVVQHDRVYISNEPSAEELVHTQTTPMPRVDAVPAAAIPPSQHNHIFEEAVGFAKDVPLALALRQVVPPEYAFSFERGVNPGQRVSWNGGKPWNEVVADMVTPLGYAVRISHKRVVIGTEKAAAASSSFVPPALIEPAAGTEEEIHDELPAELAIVDSPAKPSDTDIVISSKDAPLKTVTDVQRKRDIKRVNITDPGSVADVASQDVNVEPIQIARADIPPQEEISTTGLTSSLARDVNQDQASDKISFWTAEKGASLKDTLIAWSETADTDLVWNATYDFQLPADFEARGNFEKAVELLLKHGVSKDANLDHSYNASSNHQRVQIIIDEKA